MTAIETLRAILVGGAVVALIVALAFGQWVAAATLAVAVGVHGFITVYLHRLKTERNAAASLTTPPPVG